MKNIVKKNNSIVKYVVICLLVASIGNFAYLLVRSSTVRDNAIQVSEELKHRTSAISHVKGSAHDTPAEAPSYSWWHLSIIEHIIWREFAPYIVVSVFVTKAVWSYVCKLGLTFFERSALCVLFVVLELRFFYGLHKGSLNTYLLRYAAEGGLNDLKWLLSRGVDINTKSMQGDTVLILSAQHRHIDCLKYLVGQGADLHAKNVYRNTAFHLSAQHGHIDCLKYLVGQGADLHAKNVYGNTAFHLSAQHGHIDCLKYLVGQGADIHTKNEKYNTAFHLSAKNGHIDCLKHLVAQGADMNTRNRMGLTALLLSAQKGHVACLKYLVAQGADIYAKDKYENTAFLLSVQEGHLACLNHLLAQDTDIIHDQNRWGCTALMWSAYKGDLDSIKYLVQQGADIDTRDKNGYTALLWSAQAGHLACLKYLVEEGAEINTSDAYGNTVLLLCAYKGHLACVKYLVAQGAYIEAKNNDSNTALILSSQGGHEDCVAFLSRVQQDMKDKCTKDGSYTISNPLVLLTCAIDYDKNDSRPYAKEDMELLYNLFKIECGYEVVSTLFDKEGHIFPRDQEDEKAIGGTWLSKEQLITWIDTQVTHLQQHGKNYDALIFIFSGHGARDLYGREFIETSDGEDYLWQDIESAFVADPALQDGFGDQPKLFFKLGCRAPWKGIINKESVPIDKNKVFTCYNAAEGKLSFSLATNKLINSFVGFFQEAIKCKHSLCWIMSRFKEVISPDVRYQAEPDIGGGLLTDKIFFARNMGGKS